MSEEPVGTRSEEPVRTTCAWCGAEAEGRPLTWTSSAERGGQTRWYCERCSRENLRSIEGRLDSEWW